MHTPFASPQQIMLITDIELRPATPQDWPNIAALLETNRLPMDGA